MIKARTFTGEVPAEVDEQLERYCKNNEIVRQDIVKIYFYALPEGKGISEAHYGKLVYDDSGPIERKALHDKMKESGAVDQLGSRIE